jgi:hypothetical protein
LSEKKELLMKKRGIVILGLLAVVLALGFMLSGCTSMSVVDGGRYDSTVAESKEATLRIGGSNSPFVSPTVITRFDNQVVKWEGYHDMGLLVIQQDVVFVIKVPAGAHTLTGIEGATSGRTTIPSSVNGADGKPNPNVHETSAKVNLEAGKTYNVWIRRGVLNVKEVEQQPPQ